MNLCQILVVQISKSPNSITLSDQQPEEGKWGTEDIQIPNTTGNIDYGEILLQEIWLWIGKRLESRWDVSQFRSVCRTWRSIPPPPFRFSLRVPPPPDLSSLHNDTVFYYKDQMPNLKFEPPPVSQICNLYFLCNAYRVHNAVPRCIKEEIIADKYHIRSGSRPRARRNPKACFFPIGRRSLSNIYDLIPDFSQLHTFSILALPSHIMLIQMNQCQVLEVQINKSPNSVSLSDQQPKEEKWVTEDIDYGEILPREIWLWIGKRLESRLDVSRFRSVCRTWRSMLPPPFRFPLRVPPPPDLSSIHFDHILTYHIAEVTFYAANDMIVLFEEDYRGGKFSASAFVHKDQIPDLKFELPPLSQISNLSFLCNAYHLHLAVPQKKIAGKYNFYAGRDVLKIAILCSDGAADFNPNYPRLRDLKVVAHLINRKLAVLHLHRGAMNNNWKTGFCDIVFDDIVRYKGKLYGVDKGGSAFVMDYNSLHVTQVAAALSNPQIVKFKGYPGPRQLLHLMVVSGHLYLFVHEPKCVLAPRLYKLSFRLGKWVEADQDLPHQVFIQTLHCNFPVPMDLFRNPPTHRVCSWPKFDFVQVAVGSKNEYQYPLTWKSRGRFCDCPSLFYRKVSNQPAV